MSVRLRRLQTEYDRLRQLFDDHPRIRIVETAGDPPDRYTIEYRLKGLVQEKDTVQVRELHRAKILLGPNFPMEMPQCVMLTPVFHPNIDHLAICTEDIGSVGQKVDQIVTFIGEMITYQAYNLQSPRNGEAAKWAGEHAADFPLERIDLTPSMLLDGRALQPIAVPAATPAQAPNTKSCGNCGTRGTDASLRECSVGHLACPDCILECANCRKSLCVACDLSTCSKCQAVVCHDCGVKCTGCGSSLCAEHRGSCNECAQSERSDFTGNLPSEGPREAEMLNDKAAAAPLQTEQTPAPIAASAFQDAQEVHVEPDTTMATEPASLTLDDTPISTVQHRSQDDPLMVHALPEPVVIEGPTHSTDPLLLLEPLQDASPADPYLVYLAPDPLVEEIQRTEPHQDLPLPMEPSPQLEQALAESSQQSPVPEPTLAVEEHAPSLPAEPQLDPYLVYLAPDPPVEEIQRTEPHQDLAQPMEPSPQLEQALAESSQQSPVPEPTLAVEEHALSLPAEPQLDPYLVYLAPDLPVEEPQKAEPHPDLPLPMEPSPQLEQTLAESSHKVAVVEPILAVEEHAPSLPAEPQLDPHLVYLAPDPLVEEIQRTEPHQDLPLPMEPSPQLEQALAESSHKVAVVEPIIAVEEHAPSLPAEPQLDPYLVYLAPDLPVEEPQKAEPHPDLPLPMEPHPQLEQALAESSQQSPVVEPTQPFHEPFPPPQVESPKDPYLRYLPAKPNLVEETHRKLVPEPPRQFVAPTASALFQVTALPPKQIPNPAPNQSPVPPSLPQSMPVPKRSFKPAPPLPPGASGFQQSELIRLGGASVVAPTAHVGLVVAARTPQRIRLGQVTALKEAITVIGRGRVGCFVDDPAVAQFHAVITYQRVGEEFGFYLHTTTSASTWLNQCASQTMVKLRSGDSIAIGNTELVFFEVVLESEGSH